MVCLPLIGDETMIERQMELRRRATRKLKMRKLKVKLAAASGEAKEKILYKMKRLSPGWTEAMLSPAVPKAEKAEKPESEPKKKAAPARAKKS